jgi:NAD(P)-dependent dehydrogenase (short-subunit alcohol dehydrogenase family)
MIARKSGRIVFIASTAGLKGYAYVAPYVAAKHGVVGLMRALAVETAKTGVTVNAVCPGFTETELLADSVERIVRKTGRSAEEARASLVAGNPQGRFIQPDEIAAAVMWLIGDGAASITGQAISVSGGETW